MNSHRDAPLHAENCWNAVGVGGDRSCPRLAEAVHCRNCPEFESAARRLFDRAAPPGYVEQWTRELAEEEAEESSDAISLVVFRIAGEWLALRTAAMVEVVEPRPIHRVPHRGDPPFLGLVNIRGELQLCVSLGELLGLAPDGARPGGPNPPSPLAPASGSGEKLLVFEQGTSRWVSPVDEVAGVCRVPAESLEEVPATVARSARRCTRAVAAWEGRRIGLLDDGRVFDALERAIR